MNEFREGTYTPLRGVNGRSALDLLAFELAQIQMVIEAAPIQKILVRALFDDLTIVDDQHLVGIADGAQPMGDHKAGPSFHQPQKGRLDPDLGAAVDAAGRLIQDQDARIGKDGPGDGQKLALALAEVAGPSPTDWSDILAATAG